MSYMLHFCSRSFSFHISKVETCPYINSRQHISLCIQIITVTELIGNPDKNDRWSCPRFFLLPSSSSSVQFSSKRGTKEEGRLELLGREAKTFLLFPCALSRFGRLHAILQPCLRLRRPSNQIPRSKEPQASKVRVVQCTPNASCTLKIHWIMKPPRSMSPTSPRSGLSQNISPTTCRRHWGRNLSC